MPLLSLVEKVDIDKVIVGAVYACQTSYRYSEIIAI